MFLFSQLWPQGCAKDKSFQDFIIVTVNRLEARSIFPYVAQRKVYGNSFSVEMIQIQV